jgi:hypothetical protein
MGRGTVKKRSKSQPYVYRSDRQICPQETQLLHILTQLRGFSHIFTSEYGGSRSLSQAYLICLDPSAGYNMFHGNQPVCEFNNSKVLLVGDVHFPNSNPALNLSA